MYLDKIRQKLTENNLEMYYNLFTVEKSQDIRLPPSFWGILVRFSTLISQEECPFSSLTPSRSSKSAAVPYPPVIFPLAFCATSTACEACKGQKSPGMDISVSGFR